MRSPGHTPQVIAWRWHALLLLSNRHWHRKMVLELEGCRVVRCCSRHLVNDAMVQVPLPRRHVLQMHRSSIITQQQGRTQHEAIAELFQRRSGAWCAVLPRMLVIAQSTCMGCTAYDAGHCTEHMHVLYCLGCWSLHRPHACAVCGL
jgi:hypothetical protein